MNHIKKHVPCFVDVEQSSDENDFETVDELLNIPWVKRWEIPMDGHIFYRWTKSGDLLVAEYDNGEFWWVVGYIRIPEDVELPERSKSKEVVTNGKRQITKEG